MRQAPLHTNAPTSPQRHLGTWLGAIPRIWRFFYDGSAPSRHPTWRHPAHPASTRELRALSSRIVSAAPNKKKQSPSGTNSGG